LGRLAAALLIAGLAACGGSKDGGGAGGTTRLSIATGGVAGVYYVYGGAYAAAIGKSLPGYVATAEVTAASVDNLRLVGAKKSAIGFTLMDTAGDAVAGRSPFDAPIPVKALARIYTTYVQVVARDPAIRTLADLKGKRVSLGAPGSGSEILALRLLRAAGLDPDKDIRRQGLGIGETTSALADGSIDAFIWTGGLPTPGVTELAINRPIHLLPTVQYLPAMKQAFGEVYAETVIPAGVYKGVDTPMPTIGIDNLLVVHADMPEQEAHDLAKVLFEQRAAIEAVHPEARNLDLAKATATGPVPLHPGARRYFDEAAKGAAK
jgi:TRAP transporter TAXI family solute receptor